MDGSAALEHARGLLRTGRISEALAAFERLLQSEPQMARARGSYAVALAEGGRYADAAREADIALRGDPACVPALVARGLAAQDGGAPVAALADFEAALSIRPDLVGALAHTGVSASLVGEHERSFEFFESALRIVPAHPHARLGRAFALLRGGRYHDGWLEYEWRFATGAVARPAIPLPRWDGGDPNGRRILVHTEQGIGDTLQFVRFLPRLQDRGATVLFGCLPSLRPLLARTPGIDEWFPIGEPAPPDFDMHVPIGSLPGLLGADEADVAIRGPYVSPDPERVRRWEPVLAQSSGVRVGICWQGSPTLLFDPFRSIPVSHFASLTGVDGVQLVSLQRHHGEADLASHADAGAVMVLDGLDRDGATMIDTATVMQHLDLVVTCDAAIAHLAGSLGVPAWVALAVGADWRWQLHRTDSPWYPSVRLFRQPAFGDWDSVFAEIASALRDVVRAGRPPVRVLPVRLEPAVSIAVGPGELADRISILRLKASRIADPQRAAIAARELATLEVAMIEAFGVSDALTALADRLAAVNARLWDAEDAVREHERRGDFGDEFVKLARSVPHDNDERIALKQAIDSLLGSAAREVKSYAEG